MDQYPVFKECEQISEKKEQQIALQETEIDSTDNTSDCLMFNVDVPLEAIKVNILYMKTSKHEAFLFTLN